MNRNPQDIANPDDERRLMQAVACGDAAAMRLLYERHAGYLVARCARLLAADYGYVRPDIDDPAHLPDVADMADYEADVPDGLWDDIERRDVACRGCRGRNADK